MIRFIAYEFIAPLCYSFFQKLQIIALSKSTEVAKNTTSIKSICYTVEWPQNGVLLLHTLLLH